MPNRGGTGEFALAVRFDDVEHVDGNAGFAADFADCPLPCLRGVQLVQLGLQLVGLFGFLVVGFGEFLPFAGLRLPINRVRCRVAVRLPRIGRRLRLRVLWLLLLHDVGVGGVGVVRHSEAPPFILLPVRASIR
ncbi:hypothetical protein [Bifidobacterium boum]|uniref:hypothetical protein n=1 Tax=Bifidobacterium boum TaxID=78343 RepID=UPI00258FBCC4|nr:hypothetical protein [uncultured Bifidobacterium sp.]